MSIHAKKFIDLQTKTVKELKLQLSQVQNQLYKNAKKSEIITQIRLNIILGLENVEIGKEGKNE